MLRFFTPLVANMLLVMAAWAQPAEVQNTETHQPPLIMALASAPTTLDSRFTTGASASRIAGLISQPLVNLDTSFNPQPAAAKSFVWVDGRTLQFTLKNSNFVNGAPLTAHVVKRFYESIMDADTISPFRGQMLPIEHIKTVGNNKIQFLFKTPPQFVWPLFTHPIMHLGATKSPENNTVYPVGLGPYKVAAGSTLENLALKLAPTWQGAQPASQQIQFKTVKDPLVRLLKVQNGEAHILQNDMPSVFYAYAQEKENLKTLSFPSTNYTYLGFNMEDADVGMLAVREAIAYGVDRQKIMDTLLFGLASPAHSILPQNHAGFWPAPLRPHNPQKAIELLEEAGFKPDKNGVRLTLRFSTTNNPSTLLLVQALQHQLKQVGIALETNVSEWGTFYGNILQGNFQMYLLTWVGVFDADIYKSLFHSSKKPPVGANRGRFEHQEMDKHIDSLWQAGTNKVNAIKKIQQLQHEYLPYVPLWQRSNIAIMHPSVRGFTLTLDGRYDGLLNTYLAQID